MCFLCISGQEYSSQNNGYINPYGQSYSSAFRTHPVNSGLYSMKNDLDPYSYDALDSFYSSALGSYPPNVSQPAFPSNNVHSQPGSAFNVVQSNNNYVNNQSAFQSTGKYSYYTVKPRKFKISFFFKILAKSKCIWDTLDSEKGTYLWSILITVYNNISFGSVKETSQ